MNRIKELRIKKGLKQKDLAILLGTTSQTILNWENGFHEPKIEKFQALANLFGCSVDYLLNNETKNKSVDDVCEIIENIPPKVLANVIRLCVNKKE